MPNITEDLTVTVKGERYTLTGPMLDRIRFDRNRARAYQQAREAGAEAMTRRDLRLAIEDAFVVSPDTARMILAAVKIAPVADWRPDELDLAVRWDRGWKLYHVTGTRHAYYLLRKLAGREGFQGARLNDPLLRSDGVIVDNVIHLSVSDITGPDTAGKYRALLDRSNRHYDLARDDREV